MQSSRGGRAGGGVGSGGVDRSGVERGRLRRGRDGRVRRRRLDRRGSSRRFGRRRAGHRRAGRLGGGRGVGLRGSSAASVGGRRGRGVNRGARVGPYLASSSSLSFVPLRFATRRLLLAAVNDVHEPKERWQPEPQCDEVMPHHPHWLQHWPEGQHLLLPDAPHWPPGAAKPPEHVPVMKVWGAVRPGAGRVLAGCTCF